MTTPDHTHTPDTDTAAFWEARFQQQVSENIRNREAGKIKVAEQAIVIQQQKDEISALKRTIEQMRPAPQRARAAEQAAEQAAERWNEAYRAIRDAKKQIAQGHRRAMEDVAEWLAGQIKRMPKPDTDV